MPLGYINPQERDWRDALNDWLETATDEDLYSTHWSILLENRSMFADMTDKRAIEEEIERRNVTGFHR